MSDLLVLVQGTFGDAVATALARDHAVRVAPLATDPLDRLLEGVDFVAVASWRRDLAACERVDAACVRSGVTWSLAVLDGSELLNGPCVVPGGPCFACYRRRWLTHVPTLDRERTLDAAYAADASLGPAGWLPGLVEAAAAGLRCDREDRDAGRIRWIDAMSGHAGETRVVRVGGCARCGERGGAERYTARLVPALAEVLA
jgi:bacteriocin biosynthesis cyclodehydratase domain-containing protein